MRRIRKKLLAVMLLGTLLTASVMTGCGKDDEP